MRRATDAEMKQLRKNANHCFLCKKPFTKKDPAVVDHRHQGVDPPLTSGEIRAILHRSCNSAEGKIKFALKHCHKGVHWSTIVANLIPHSKLGMGLLHPSHKPLVLVYKTMHKIRKLNKTEDPPAIPKDKAEGTLERTSL